LLHPLQHLLLLVDCWLLLYQLPPPLLPQPLGYLVLLLLLLRLLHAAMAPLLHLLPLQHDHLLLQGWARTYVLTPAWKWTRSGPSSCLS
jgi:hypothetical protein